MAPPRTFNYDLLRDLIREHPGLQYAELADLLTQEARKTNPNAKPVLPDSLRRVVSQYRSIWEAEGVEIPRRGVVHADLAPPMGTVAPNQRMTTPLRYLREISKERRGEVPVTDPERIIRGQAIKWETRMRANREVVDITDLGTVEIRPARAGELNGNGELTDLAAWVFPDWRGHQRQNLRGRS